jgi:hypothetical protein
MDCDEMLAREAGDSGFVYLATRLSPAFAGSGTRYDFYLGLTPQALCCRLLRRLKTLLITFLEVSTHRIETAFDRLD